jgi:hypothetical protein
MRLGILVLGVLLFVNFAQADPPAGQALSATISGDASSLQITNPTKWSADCNGVKATLEGNATFKVTVPSGVAGECQLIDNTGNQVAVMLFPAIANAQSYLLKFTPSDVLKSGSSQKAKSSKSTSQSGGG